MTRNLEPTTLTELEALWAQYKSHQRKLDLEKLDLLLVSVDAVLEGRACFYENKGE